MSYAEQYDAAGGIAIVGMAGRFPGAPDVESLWRLVRDGRDALGPVPTPPAAPAGDSVGAASPVTAGLPSAQLDEVDCFDEGFFGLEPAEVARIDPRHRLFLQAAWEAFEHAGHDPASFGGLIGVYACGEPDPAWLGLARGDRQGARRKVRVALADPGHGLASRTASALDLRGPALDIAASAAGGLAAVCQAVQALQSFQCDLALAGAVALELPRPAARGAGCDHPPRPDGRGGAFDALAGGTAPADGVAIVVLRRLADALEAGDTIHAVIRGVALNHEGRAGSGRGVPSVDSQATVIATAQALAGIDPQTIGYIEADAGADVLADAVELAALTQAFRAGGASAAGACALGSVKSQLGHLGVASGVAGLMRATLAVQHGILPAHLHFQAPHPALELSASPFEVNAAVRPWPGGTLPRRAGVSGFGAGGSNAHVVLEQAPAAAPRDPGRAAAAADDDPQLLVLSARDPRALDRATGRLQRHLQALAAQEGPRPALADITRTLQAGRRAFACRRAWACTDLDDALAQLSAPVTPQAASTGQVPAVAFLFADDGAPLCSTGRDLHAGEPVFRDELDACARALLDPLGGDLREWLFPAPGQEEAARQRLARTDTGQPVLLAVQLAVARLWESWGVEPALLLGHGVGEFAAACLGGTFDRDDVLGLVAQRARLLQQLPGGAMLAVLAPAEELQAELGEGVDIAARQAPSLTVLSGPAPAIGRVAALLERRGVGHRRLEAAHALQSSMVDPVLPAFEAAVQRTPRRVPRRPWISGLTGRPVTAEQAQSPNYWARQLRETAHVADGLSLCLSAGAAVLEIGPGDSLARLALRHTQRDRSPLIVAALPGGEASADRDGRRQLRAAAGRLWCAGVPLDWAALNPRGARRVPLPGYPFARNRHPLVPPSAVADAPSAPRAGAAAAVPADWMALFARQLAIMGEQLEMIRQGLGSAAGGVAAAGDPRSAAGEGGTAPGRGSPAAPAADEEPGVPG